jgi:regulator of protease activity HflC (stomatin/prohibitin superfamily)
MLAARTTSGRWVTVNAWQRAVVLRDGSVLRVASEGRHRRRRREEWWLIDVRTRSLLVQPQEVLTSDGLQVRVSLILTFGIVDAAAWLTVAAEPGSELYTLAQVALRTAVAAHTLDELLASRESVASDLDGIRDAARSYGAEVTGFEVRDITLPQELRQAFTAPALARAEGAAKLERARGEAAAVRSLANTAQVLEAHPSLLHLRALESAGHIVVKIVPAGELEPQ